MLQQCATAFEQKQAGLQFLHATSELADLPIPSEGSKTIKNHAAAKPNPLRRGAAAVSAAKTVENGTFATQWNWHATQAHSGQESTYLRQ